MSREVLLGRGLALVLRPKEAVCGVAGFDLFAEFRRANPSRARDLECRGVLRPSTLLLTGTDYALEVLRSAWGRRTLCPPLGYEIVALGDLDPVMMGTIAQPQFAPLPEAICKAVAELHREGVSASAPQIAKKLRESFPGVAPPSATLLHRTLGTLIRERKLYHAGAGYAPALDAKSAPRLMLLSNEEAIVRLHGDALDDGRTACTQTRVERNLEPNLVRCHSLKLLKNSSTGEKNSVLSRLFRRRKKSKSSATQFPPNDSTDPDFVRFNSRATQTTPPTDDHERVKCRSSSLNRRDRRRSTDRFRSSSLQRKHSPKRDRTPETGTKATPAKGASPQLKQDQREVCTTVEINVSKASDLKVSWNHSVSNPKVTTTTNVTVAKEKKNETVVKDDSGFSSSSSRPMSISPC